MEANHGAGHATTARPDSRVSPGPLRHPDLNTAPVAGGGSVRTVRRRGCAQRVPPRADRAADRGAGHQDRRHGAVATADKRNDAGAMAVCDAVRSTVPQEMWGEIIQKLEELEQHPGTLDVGEDSFDDADDDPYDPTEFIDDDEF